MESLEPHFPRQMDRFTNPSVTEARKIGLILSQQRFLIKESITRIMEILSKSALIVSNLG